MAFKKIPLTIDTMIRNPVPVEGINQEDNIELNIVVTENKTPKDLSSQTIKVYVRRIDGTLVEQTDQITPTNARKGEVTVKLKNSAFNKEGYALFQLDVSDSIGRITSSYATFKIGKGLVSGEAIANTNEIEALKKVEEYIKKANQELETFKQAVAEKDENEATRQENEVVRVREEASRNEAEAIRTQQEATRKEKENERVQAEIQRIEAESVRVEAETGRVEAESLRVTAEEERVAAETKRDEKIKELENKIDNGGNNSNNEEVIQARTATTGEVFNTLDERIDHEVDRLNKKIDVTMLQQEDKESHTIENAVEGMTTDMVVKGKTLVNVVKSNRRICEKGASAHFQLIYPELKMGTYTVVINASELTKEGITMYDMINSVQYPYNLKTGLNIRKIDVREEGSTYAIIVGNDNVDGTQFMLESLMILEGDWTNKPLPQYFEGIKSFGQQEDKISILSRGKNLVKKNSFTNDEIKKWNGSDENYYVETIAGGLKQGIVWGFIESNGDLRYELAFGNNPIDITNHKSISNTREKVLQYTNGSARNTLDKDYKYAVISVRKLSEDASISKAMISNIETSYEPYKENKKDILIKEPLRSVGNIQDVLYEDNGQVKINRYVKEYTFTGDESITKENTLINITRFYIDTQCKNKVNTRNIICNNFNSNGTWWDRDEIGMYWDISIQGRLWFHIPKTEFNDVESFRNFLKTNPTTIVYQLAEPTTEIVENYVDIDLKTFNEKTYVSFENAISGTSSFKAPVNAAATISRLNRENRALEEENKTLRQDFESTTLSLTDSDLELVKQNVDIDFRLMEVEFALDIPQSTLSSNINFKKKGEVKSMARTPYAMMKIVILSGDYDREDYIHKVGKYYERGRMTKEEYDELMSLMTADEVIGG